MAQIQAGVTYATGAQVTATNLNAHVNNAVLVPGAISDQTAASSSTSADSVLLLQSGVLKKATLAQLPYINKDGSAAMTAELLLANSTPSTALAAASKGYVDTKVSKAGDTMTGALTLAADPVSALQPATKQYVDAADALKANLAGATFTGAVTLSANPTTNLQASTKQYVDTQVASVGASSVPAGAIMAFYRNAAPTGWLECNGQSVAAYPNLVALGLTNAPDLRGEFVRGWDNGKGTDPGRALASTQLDEFKGHTHEYFGASYTSAAPGGGTPLASSARSASMGNTSSTGGSETRPRNIALMYCIKT